jgi:glycosyltransferase involved in cell wall biosynthesis
MPSKKTILLITTTHLAKNPRLVKEIDALNNDYKLVVIFFQLLEEYVEFDQSIINQYPHVEFIKINWLKKYYPFRFFYTFLQKLLILIWKLSHKHIYVEQLFFPGYLLLKRRAKQVKFDFIHGHNPGSLGVVYHLAKWRKKKSGFDAEDFHSGEYAKDDPREEIINSIESKYLPKIHLLLGASPLICAAYKEKFSSLNISTINNSFPKNQFRTEVALGQKNELKLVWFSQNVGLDRGLDDILKSINQIQDFKISFSIIGACNAAVKETLKAYVENKRHQLTFCGLMSNEELNHSLSKFDVGIASEPGKDINNCIALSNKIFAYTQAGLAVLASNTPAQKYFMKTYTGVGCVYTVGDTERIKNILNKWYKDPIFLTSCKETAKLIGETRINWEIEAGVLKKLIAEQLAQQTDQLNIAITVDPEIPVPPTLYGGIERIVYLLVEELIKRGHSVTLFAHPKSNTSAKLVPWRGKSSPSFFDTLQNSYKLWQYYQRESYDVVHSFSRLAYLSPLLNKKVAKVMSYQREPTVSQVKKARLIAKGNSLAFTGCSDYISDQLKHVAQVTTVYNGVELSKYQFEPAVKEDAPLVFLGRIEQIKGTHLAIELAKHSGKKLIIAGNIPRSGREYFEIEIFPQLNENIRYIGAVNDEQKNELLGKACALLMPILWDEPFGIVMIEAMACGTPVIGLNRGAVKEVIVAGKNGYIGSNMDDLLSAIRRISSIDRSFVRTYVEETFSASVIVDQYLEVYKKTMQACKEN